MIKVMKLKIPKTLFIFRVIDILMIPLMYVLGGFKSDSLQETHPWHSWRDFSENDIDIKESVVTFGTDEKTFSKHFLFLFHAPLFGGWKNYTVYAPTNGTPIFHIGWIVHENTILKEIGISTLPIKNGAIRMLDGPPTYKVNFFAIDKNGNQVALHKVGSGRLGDYKYRGIRLF